LIHFYKRLVLIAFSYGLCGGGVWGLPGVSTESNLSKTR